MAMQDFSHSLPMLLYRALDAVMPRFRRIFNEAGLTEQQWRVLRVLWEHDAIAQNELAALTLIPAPSLVGVLDRLAAVGLVERQRSAADRRSMRVGATSAGRQLEERVMPAVAAVYAELQDSLPAATWMRLQTDLATVVATTAAIASAAPAGTTDVPDTSSATERTPP